MEETVIIKSAEYIAHNVLQFITEKPRDYEFTPGQATELSIGRKEWKDEKRPFTFTSLPGDEFLEFTIKVYPSHKGVTAVLPGLVKGDSLIVRDAWGALL